jgi:hypothetical protein
LIGTLTLQLPTSSTIPQLETLGWNTETTGSSPESLSKVPLQKQKRREQRPARGV